LRDLSRALPRPDAILSERRQRLDNVAMRLPQALLGFVRQKQVLLSKAALRPVILAQDVHNKRERLAWLAPQLPRALLGLVGQKRLYMAKFTPKPAPLFREIKTKKQSITMVCERFARAAMQQQLNRRQRLGALERTRQSLGYTNTLKRGYAVVRGDGAVVVSRAAAKKAQAIEIEFADGRVALGQSTTPPKRKTSKPESGQGSLF